MTLNVKRCMEGTGRGGVTGSLRVLLNFRCAVPFPLQEHKQEHYTWGKGHQGPQDCSSETRPSSFRIAVSFLPQEGAAQ